MLSGLQDALPTGDRSNLLKALTTTLANRPGRPLAAVVLLSDGADNVDLPRDRLPAEVREKLAETGVPIHTVAFGAERGFRDLDIVARCMRMTSPSCAIRSRSTR